MLKYSFEKYNNFLLNQKEIKEQKLVFNSKPLLLTFSITNVCQLDCIMCGLRKKSTNKHLNYKKIKSFIEYYGSTAVTVEWIGGEPLTHPYFKNLLDYANSFELSQVLVTNGLLLKGSVAEKIVKYNMDIRISIDGCDSKTYNYIRKNGNFDVLLENINNFNILRKKYNHKGHFGINFCVLKQNYKQIVDMIDFAHKYNFQAIEFIDTIFDENSPLKCHRIEDIRKLIELARKKASEYKILCLDFFSNNNENIKKNNGCINPFCSLGLTPVGNITTCICNDVLVKNCSLDSWNSEDMQEYRKQIYNKCLPNKSCYNKCSLSSIRNFYHPKVSDSIEHIKNNIIKE